MTKLLTWRNEWSLGIDTLDRDHRALIERMGDLCVRYCPQLFDPRAQTFAGSRILASFDLPGQQSTGLLADLQALGEQMRAHMRREEAFMRAIGYERLAEHQGEHAILMAEYREMLRGWQDSGLQVFSESTQEGVRRWLLDHILGADREFAEFYFRICGQDGLRVGHG